MSKAIHLIEAWAGLISDVFGKYPLEAAIFTILAYPAYLHLEREPPIRAKRQRETNIFLIFVAWLVCVPILGAVLGILYWLLGGVGNAIGLLTTVYDRFVEQPIVVLALATIALASYFVLGSPPTSRPATPRSAGRRCVSDGHAATRTNRKCDPARRRRPLQPSASRFIP